MQIGFYCPDKVAIRHEDCLKQCRMAHRCVTLPTLYLMARTRAWKGLPSVTQCLKGTMEAFLTITKDYYVSPQNLAFALLGTKHHQMLDDSAKKLLGIVSEERFDDEDVGGTADVLELSTTDNVLTDYKTWGSYKVAKALGFTKSDVPTGEFYKSGERKGQEKTRSVKGFNPAKSDMKDAVLQVNRYRIALQKAGHKIDRMQIQATVRDGGVAAAYKYDLKDNIYLIPIPFMEDAEVMNYFANKSECLLTALSTGVWVTPCSQEERWDDDRKCKKYCAVADQCVYGQEVLAKVAKEDEE